MSFQVLIESNSETITRFYDVVFVCNGHFFEPLNPYQNSYFKGKLIHSHDYRRAEHYTGKNVVIVGAGPSGIDITLQIAQTANHVNLENFENSEVFLKIQTSIFKPHNNCLQVTLISKKATYPVLPESVQQMATNVKSVDEHGVVTDEGDHVPADVIIVCTGYVFKVKMFKPA